MAEQGDPGVRVPLAGGRVGLRTLAAQDSVAADVSGASGITPYDASLVLRYVVGEIVRFPVEESGVR